MTRVPMPFLLCILGATLLPTSVAAWGLKGHSVIGAIADIDLEKSPAALTKVRELLDSNPLQEAAR